MGSQSPLRQVLFGEMGHSRAVKTKDWKYIAVVMVSGKACFFYVNGQLITARSAELPLTRNRGDDIHLGGWSHGYLRGDIAEVRLYNRALSAMEIQRNGGRPEEDCELLVNATGGYSYHRRQFICDLFSSLEGTEAETINVRVLEPASQRVVGERKLPIASLSGNAGHGFTRLTLPGQSALDGDHTTPWQPVLRHDDPRPLTPGEIVPVDIEVLPSSTLFRAGESLQLVVQGRDLFEHPALGHAYSRDVNQGVHAIHTGGEFDSHLLIPQIV